MRTYPRKNNPGPGLPGYELTRHIREPTLYVTQKRPDPIVNLPSHVSLLEVGFADPLMMAEQGWRKLITAPAKALSYGTFFARSIYPIVRWKPNIIHAHSLPALLHGVIGSYVTGAPWVFSFHGTELLRCVHSPLRELVGRADCLFYVSEHMERAIAETFPSVPRLYTPSGVDTDVFFPDESVKREELLVTIGRFVWQKGYAVMAEALPGIFRTLPTFRLKMVGSGPLEEDFRRRLRRLGLERRVDIISSLDRRGIVDLLRRSTLMLLPSISEGFPKVLLEAMATETPVVASDTGSCASVLGEAGTIVPPGDPNALANAVIALCRDPERLKAMGEIGRRRAEQYSWKRTAQLVERKFQELVVKGR